LTTPESEKVFTRAAITVIRHFRTIRTTMSIIRYSANVKRKIPNLLGAALVVVCMLTATAGERVPFKGQSSGVVTTVGFDPVKGIAYTHVSGTGQATHLGQFTVSGDVAVEVATGIPLGTWTLTAANGDMLFLKMGGHGIDATHGFGAFTVVGGSGRFQGAAGYYEQIITFAIPLGTAETISYTDVLEGTISSGLQ
jgi:hypothetical protein